MPVLIQWLNGPHPALTLPASGCSLETLQTGFDGASQFALDARCAAGRELIASIQSPRGLRTLRTSPSA
jgi:hypothetical protein